MIPYSATNYIFGANEECKLWTFIWVSEITSIPYVCFYVVVGSSLSNLLGKAHVWSNPWYIALFLWELR